MSLSHRKTVFIAGASGAIGRRLCSLLLEHGWQVIGTTRHPDKAQALQALGISPVIVDVFNRKALIDAVCAAAPSMVIHQLSDLPFALVAEKMAAARVRNAHLRETGTANLIEAAIQAGVSRMVAQSIAFAYAPNTLPYREDMSLNIDDANAGLSARAVASLEQQVLAAPFSSVVLRYGKLYGPNTGFDAPVSGGVHVDAAADAARRALGAGAGIYNIADDDGVTSIEKARAELAWRPDFRSSL